MKNLTTDFTSAPPEEKRATFLEAGEYQFTVISIDDFKTSQNGNKMLPMKLKFTSPDGSTVDVLDRLVFTEKAIYRINQFIAAIGIPNGTRMNFLDPDFIRYLCGKTGVAALEINEWVSKSGKPGKDNVVANYIYNREVSKHLSPPAHKEIILVDPEDDDDDLPF